MSVLDEPWYVVGQPWIHSNQEPYVIAGNYDPHVGKFVFSCDRLDIDNELTQEDFIACSYAICEHICELHNKHVEGG